MMNAMKDTETGYHYQLMRRAIDNPVIALAQMTQGIDRNQ